MIWILKYIFHFSVLFLIVISLWPGSLLGFLFYGDWEQQPNLVENPFGTTINHFIYYIYLSLLGFFIYLKNENFKKLVYGLFFLSITLELLHFIIPNRAFQLADLLSNIFGVMVAYLVIKIYLFVDKS
jgi:VanZ family protein|tara:strand:+ start:1000 stop:1383 length:384 start_codon:yes stop_codon:yes gene_type:complete